MAHKTKYLKNIVFWAMEFQEKMVLGFTDLYSKLLKKSTYFQLDLRLLNFHQVAKKFF